MATPTPHERPVATRLLELFAKAPKFTHNDSAKMLQHGWNGVYLMFESGATLPDGGLRVTRVGSHRMPSELKRRLEENAQTGQMGKNAFRRQVASALMKRAGKETKEIAAAVDNKAFPHHIDVRTTEYIREHCSYSVIVTGADLDRIFGGVETPWLELEKRLTGQLAYALPMPSADWLGFEAMDEKIRHAGLWNSANLTNGWKGVECPPDEELLKYIEQAFP